MGEIFDEYTSRLATLQAENRELFLDVKMYKESFVHKNKLAALQAENARLNQDTIERLKQRVKELESSSLCVYCGNVQHTKPGQSKLDMMIEHMAECDKHPVANLLVKIERLKAVISAYEEEVDSPEDIRELKQWIKKYEGIAIENGKLKSDKRELVKECQMIALDWGQESEYLLINSVGSDISVGNTYKECAKILSAAVAKHKEVAPK